MTTEELSTCKEQLTKVFAEKSGLADGSQEESKAGMADLVKDVVKVLFDHENEYTTELFTIKADTETRLTRSKMELIIEA